MQIYEIDFDWNQMAIERILNNFYCVEVFFHFAKVHLASSPLKCCLVMRAIMFLMLCPWCHFNLDIVMTTKLLSTFPRSNKVKWCLFPPGDHLPLLIQPRPRLQLSQKSQKTFSIEQLNICVTFDEIDRLVWAGMDICSSCPWASKRQCCNGIGRVTGGNNCKILSTQWDSMCLNWNKDIILGSL